MASDGGRQQVERRGESGGGQEVGDSILLDAAHEYRVSDRPFVSKAAGGGLRVVRHDA